MQNSPGHSKSNMLGHLVLCAVVVLAFSQTPEPCRKYDRESCILTIMLHGCVCNSLHQYNNTLPIRF